MTMQTNNTAMATSQEFRKERTAYDKAMVLALDRAGYGCKRIKRVTGFCNSVIARIRFPANREKQRIYAAKWRTENREKDLASSRAYMAKRWKEDPSFRARAYAVSRARKRQTSDDLKRLTSAERSQYYRIQERKPEGYHIDHIWPIFRRHEPGAPANIEHPSNLAYLTQEENLRKKAKLVSELDWTPNYIYPDLD